MSNKNAEASVHHIKKYPNRRFYDSTAGTHVTLQELHNYVRAGNQIIVTDSKTGEEITNAVLAQIILELDPPKLELFPATLLHQAIQSNQKVIRGFIEQYFAQAMDAFVNSRQSFDQYLKQMGMGVFPPNPADWSRMFFGGKAAAHAAPPPVPDSSPEPGDSVDALRGELESLRADLAELRRSAKPDKPSKSKRSPKKP